MAALRCCPSKDVLEHSEGGTSIIAVQRGPTEARIHRVDYDLRLLYL